jgi:hypothetical protein
MRCREAIDRLNLIELSAIEQDKELREHLKSCSTCARQAEAARELHQILIEATVPDEVDQITWPEQVCRVEDAASRSRRTQPREIPVMSALKRQFNLRPRLSASLAAAVVVLLAATLIPLKFDQTVGFEVAVAGVDRDLALNEDRMNEFLKQLGVSTAQINVTGCDTTCRLVVSNLRSSSDARLVAKAFEGVGQHHIIVSLSEIKEEVSGSALSHAMHKVLLSNANVGWTTDAGDTLQLRIGGDTCPGAVFFYAAQPDDTSGTQKVPLQTMHIFINGDSTGASDAQLQPHQIANLHLTDEARAEFEAQGYAVDETRNADGTWDVKIKPADGGVGQTSSSIDDSDTIGISRENALPEGFSLMQNKPNPFNPSTDIGYSIPQSARVSLEIFNINGQKVRTLVNEVQGAGEHTVIWDGKSDYGDHVASGVYLYRLTAGETTTTRKMTLLK